MARLRPTQPGDLPTGGGLAPVPVANSLGFAAAVPQADGAVFSSWAGRSTRPARNDLRSTIRPYDQLPLMAGDTVLLEEPNRDTQIGQQFTSAPFVIPGPRRLEPTTYRGE